MELPPDWATAVGPWLDARRWSALRDRVAAERCRSTVLPPEHLVLEALRRTPFDAVRVAIVGQDPYHGAGQATGLAFAVAPGVSQPPSLVNLLCELRDDLGVASPGHGWLGAWADRGVLLLNTVLTVREDAAGSHHALGWETLADAILRALAARDRPVVFALLGGPARKKAALLGDRPVIAVAHPSPLSLAHFAGCKLFSRIDAAVGEPLDWRLPADPGPGPDLGPREDPAVRSLRARPPADVLRHLLALPVWTRCTADERRAIGAALETVLPRRFAFEGLADGTARFRFDDPDRSPRRFHLVAGGVGTLGRDPRKARLTAAVRARFAAVAGEAGWPADFDAWYAAELPAPRPALVAPFLYEADEALPSEPLLADSPARDLDPLGRIAATLARDGLRLPSPDEAEWALSAGRPAPFCWAPPAPSPFGIPWPRTDERTSEPDCARRAVAPADPSTAAGWRAALATCPAAFTSDPGPARIRRVRAIFPYEDR